MKIIIKNELYEGKFPYTAKEIVTKLEINIIIKNPIWDIVGGVSLLKIET